ncbi:MAG: hypothetical protein MUE61_21030 [Vicinamibacterales bacterium]|nr:hypothetical protein [Vicinamibacterales bacterium]
MMQAFAYRHLVPADSLKVTVLARGGTRVPARIMGSEIARMPAGGSARMRVTLPAVRAFENIQLELSEPPEGVALRDVVVGGGARARSSCSRPTRRRSSPVCAAI